MNHIYKAQRELDLILVWAWFGSVPAEGGGLKARSPARGAGEAYLDSESSNSVTNCLMQSLAELTVRWSHAAVAR